MAQSSIRDARRFGAPRRAEPGVSPSERHRFASVEGRGSVSPGRFDRRSSGPPHGEMSTAGTCLAVLAGVLIALLAVAIPLALPTIAHGMH